MQKRNLIFGAALALTVGAAGCASEAIGGDAAMNSDYQAAGMVPTFQVDPFWPKPLPNHWIMGATIGVDVDSHDNIWLVHRNTPDQFAANTEAGADQDPPVSECCAAAPPVLAFDQDGNLIQSWGGPGTETGDYVWPGSNHGITVDAMDNVWIGGNGRTDAGQDRHILKLTADGQFLAQFGTPGDELSSQSMEFFGRVAKVFVDDDANEVYVADGYINQRVAVIDATTGEFKRTWGAYGNEPTDESPPRYEPGETPPQQFRTPVHCAEKSNDGLIYVCDRPSNRVSVFQPDGTFVDEFIFAPATRSQGSTWDIDFSPDEEQTWIYMADGQNMKVYVIHRETMELAYSFGDGGRQPGLFFAVHSIAVDSHGNIYTTETYEGKRIQKFTFMGMGEASGNAGPAWPADRRRSGS
jgi:DNA-binding beta-propeller fold protein YncE